MRLITRATLLLCLLSFYPVNGQSGQFAQSETLEPITINNAASIQEIENIEMREGIEVYNTAFNAASNLIAYTTSEFLSLWELSTQTELWQAAAEGGGDVLFSPDNTHLAAFVNYGLHLWDVEGQGDPIMLSTPTQREIRRVTDIAFAPPRNELIAVFAQGGALRRWEATTGEFVSEYAFDLDESMQATHSILSPDASVNVLMRIDAVLELRNTVRGEIRNRIQIDELSGLDARFIPLAVSYDNEVMVVSAEFADISLSNWIILLGAGGEIGNQVEHPHGMIWTGVFSPNGEIVALGNRNNGEIYIWDAATGEELITLTGHTEWITSLTFNAEGTLLMSSSTDGTIRLWGVPAGGK